MRAAALALFGLVFLADAAAAPDETAVPREYQIKAAFLYNFAKYVDWPARSFPSKGSPFVIGVYCPDWFAPVLGKVVEGRAINGRGIAVRTLHTADEAKLAQVAYVCAGNEALWGAIETEVKDSPTLTVADSGEYGNTSATILFVRAGDKVRFSIDMDKARGAGLKVSDQLQKLAVSVKRTP